ncbi:Sec-independent protein translocase protein TatB [Photobacterium sanguinicancri]|uniref:Sec-independent protein translocase protein TatB n=1 Tax=Photobacterium sanguinicancri TaxID=875932 RepID=UPI0021C377D5|nr:Sec-independent protein translocase protein TatB [Photobacterium sanguinicancri]
MFDFGMFELIMIVVVGLVVLGPKELLEMVKNLVSLINKAKTMASNISQQLETELNPIDTSKKTD